MKERKDYLDIAKGLLMIIVIFHHIAFQAKMVGLENGCIQWNFTFLPFYSAWFMPAFFFITGYCTTFEKPFGPFILKNLTTLIWPMVMLGLIDFLFCYCVWGLEGVEKDWDTFFLICGINWFLISLFISKSVYWLIVKWLKSELFRLVIVAIIAVLAIYCNDIEFLGGNWLHHRHGLYLTLFLCLGQVAKNRELIFNKVLLWVSLAYGLCVLAGCLFSWPPIGIAGLWISFDVFNMPIHVLLAFLGICFIIWISKCIGTNAFLQYVGKNSLVIYIFHTSILKLFVWYISIYILNPQNRLEASIFNLICVVGTCLVCLVLCVVLNLNGLHWLVSFPADKLQRRVL